MVVTQTVERVKNENGPIVKDPVGSQATPTYEFREDSMFEPDARTSTLR